MKSAIYIRVSTNYQIDKDSLPLQRKDMINHSKYILGIEDYEIFEDAGFSGKNTDRPAFRDMIKRIKQGEFTHLLVWKIDRISRNLIDFCEMYEDLKRYDCAFISKNEQFDSSTAMGEAMLKIILVFAELERKLTAERVTAVMLDRASKGLWNGAPIPLGYKWDENIKFPIIDEKEEKIIKLIFEKYREFKSTSVVRTLLNENNIQTKRGGSWTTKTVSDIIRNPFYKGTYRYNYKNSGRGKKKHESEWIILENNHKGIILNSLWQECNNIMDDNAKRNCAIFRKNVIEHCFRGLIRCEKCGEIMTCKIDKAQIDGYRPTMYLCKNNYNKNGCTQKIISEKVIGDYLIRVLKENSEKVFVKENIKNKNLKDENKRNYLNKEIKKYSLAQDKLLKLHLFSELSSKDYLEKKHLLNLKIAELKKKLDSLKENEVIYSNKELLEIIKKANSWKELLQSIGRKKIRELIISMINEIIIRDKEVLKIDFLELIEIKAL